MIEMVDVSGKEFDDPYVGQYKMSLLLRLELLYDKLGKKYNFLELAKLSRKDLQMLRGQAYYEIHKNQTE